MTTTSAGGRSAAVQSSWASPALAAVPTQTIPSS